MIESKYLQDNMQNIQKLMNIQTLKHFEIKSLAKLFLIYRNSGMSYEEAVKHLKEATKDYTPEQRKEMLEMINRSNKEL